MFIESVGRYDRLFQKHPPAKFAQFTERVPMVKGRLDLRLAGLGERACGADAARLDTSMPEGAGARRGLRAARAALRDSETGRRSSRSHAEESSREQGTGVAFRNVVRVRAG